MERELYNLKTKILRSKHISDQLREELANDVFKIEKLVNKTKDIHDVSCCDCKKELEDAKEAIKDMQDELNYHARA